MRRIFARCPRVIAGLVCAAVAAIAAPALGFACAPLAQLSVTPGDGAPGAAVTLIGAGFPARGGPVLVRWSDDLGTVAASATPDAGGRVAIAVEVPALQPGVHYVIAAQGAAAPGWGARAAFEVLAPARPAAAANPPSADPAAGRSLPPWIPALAIAAAVGAVGALLVVLVLWHLRVRRGRDAW